MIDSDDYDGEYYQVPLEASQEDFCGCVKPAGCYGKWGWHWTPEGLALEPCPAYRAKIKKNAPRRAHRPTKRQRKG